MANIPLSSVCTERCDVFQNFIVNNVGFVQEYPEFFAKVPEEVSCDIELLPFGDKVGGDFLPQYLHSAITKLSRSTVIR